jgi:hypothetical protein
MIRTSVSPTDGTTYSMNAFTSHGHGHPGHRTTAGGQPSAARVRAARGLLPDLGLPEPALVAELHRTTDLS